MADPHPRRDMRNMPGRNVSGVDTPDRANFEVDNPHLRQCGSCGAYYTTGNVSIFFTITQISKPWITEKIPYDCQCMGNVPPNDREKLFANDATSIKLKWKFEMGEVKVEISPPSLQSLMNAEIDELMNFWNLYQFDIRKDDTERAMAPQQTDESLSTFNPYYALIYKIMMWDIFFANYPGGYLNWNGIERGDRFLIYKALAGILLKGISFYENLYDMLIRIHPSVSADGVFMLRILEALRKQIPHRLGEIPPNDLSAAYFLTLFFSVIHPILKNDGPFLVAVFYEMDGKLLREETKNFVKHQMSPFLQKKGIEALVTVYHRNYEKRATIA